MSFDFPQFQERVPIDAARSWTASFDAYDPWSEESYYLLTIFAAEHVVSRFYVQVGLWWANEDCPEKELVDRLREEIHAVAAQGRSNTDYRGSLTELRERRHADTE